MASSQLGLIHRDQLRDSGLSDAAIGRRVRAGLLVRRRVSVFCFAGTPRFDRQLLMEEVLSIGANAALSHDSAAHVWGLINRAPAETHVVVDRWRREHRTSCRVHESLDLVETDYVLLDGLRLTNPARTVVDLGATSPWLVERALSNGLRTGAFDLGHVEAFVKRVQRRGRRGVGVIRPFLDLHRASPGRTESVLEDRFLRVLAERGVPLPQAQYRVFDVSGAVVCRADFGYPEDHLLIELDGHAYHSDIERFQSDRDKQNATQALGWKTLRFTWADVTRDPDRTARTVARMLDASVLA